MWRQHAVNRLMNMIGAFHAGDTGVCRMEHQSDRKIKPINRKLERRESVEQT